jgi:hypothetical protein
MAGFSFLVLDGGGGEMTASFDSWGALAMPGQPRLAPKLSPSQTELATIAWSSSFNVQTNPEEALIRIHWPSCWETPTDTNKWAEAAEADCGTQSQRPPWPTSTDFSYPSRRAATANIGLI